MEILVFGDSVAYGAWDAAGGWVQRLKGDLDATMQADPKIDNLLYNLSFSGSTTDMLLKRVDSEIRNRLIEGEPMAVVFAMGINDSAFFTDRNENWVNRKRFAENLRSLLKIARRYTQHVIFVGLTPVDESKTAPIPWVEFMNYRNEYVREYDAEIRRMCKENGIPFMDLLGALSKTDYGPLLDDGVHPNARGHKRIFEIAKAYLEEKKIID